MFYLPKTNIKIGLAVLFTGLALLFSPPLSHAAEQILYKGTVFAFKLNIRSSQSRHSDVVATLNKGDQVDVIKAEGGIGGWLTVVYQGRTGYVRNRPRYITLSAPSESSLVVKPKIIRKKSQINKPKQKAEIKPEPEKKSAAEKEVIARQIEDETRKIENFSQKETEILDSLNEIDYSLNQARIKSKTLIRESEILTRQIQEIQREIQEMNDDMSQVRGYAGERLEALYRMHMMGSLEMSAAPSSLYEFFITQRAMKQVVASDFSLLSRQAENLERLIRLKTELEAQIEIQADLEKELDRQIRIKEEESRKKEAILKGIQNKKQLSQAAVASLRKAAESLGKTLDSMGLSGSAALDDTSFLRQKGQLKIPVQGEIISHYGRSQNGDYNAFTFQSGIDIRVERGEPVRSVFKGEVMFSQWLKGYGNMVIINHGDNYYTLYAHVEEIFKKKGETVSTGEVIATAGDTGSIKGMCLHFEVRHHGKPVNPMKWLKKGA